MIPGQQPETAPKQEQSGMGGISSAGSFAPVYDAQKRPITAGGFVDSGPVVFEDASKSSGLASWQHVMGTKQKKYILETDGSGVGLVDYDNDGWLDIYLVNGSTYDALSGKSKAPHAALFHNNHDGTFTDVAAKAGVTNDRWGFGVAIADYDNDGWPDIFVCNYGANRLYRNNHDGTFIDMAVKAGVTLGNWSDGATWGDYDGDGRVDLFVSGYVHYDLDRQPTATDGSVPFSYCQLHGIPVMCGPRGLKGETDHLFHQNADGTFTDVSVKAGVADPGAYYGFSATFVDVNNDGRVDLLVANDSEPNYLYINKGDGTFEDQSYVSGFALNKDGREIASMGLAVGDYNNDGFVDMLITDFSDDFKALFRSDGMDNGAIGFSDVGDEAGITQMAVPFVGWGAGFPDYDNDGWKDIMMVNGHVYPQVDEHDWGTTFAERPLLFRNNGNGKFTYIPPVKGTGLATVTSGRGAAFGDLFNNGKIDAVINPIDGPPVLLKNVSSDKHHWVEFKLIGSANPANSKPSPRDAVGATVYLTANGQRQRADVMSGGSYISSNDSRPHFGLGDATDAGTAEIHWPSGQIEKVKLPAPDRIYTIREGAGIISALCAGKPCKADHPAPAKRRP
ncbi:CRTAC1 family protein [Occallatibacter riparius]|uniref:CRTAC1 family protein n=1 Tax=Occallatibacter riparius TaxID=1002689 RepID=A0A9J7BZ40_9BACT|nr:CRTAC1 family protein [Occallatibacter riparius]UWZ86989.1 CRTAC1 family protein [Occallatibacter riparius]